MSPLIHRLYIGAMTAVVIATTIYLAYYGYDYYQTPLEERFYHPKHDWFKASGPMGHGIGIMGTLFMLIGVVMYLVRKRSARMARWGRLKYWLEFHIFLCTLGPILVLFHTTFKFGGIVSIAFWSMVLVVLSGVIGRFIYQQIPRTIEGRALSLSEVKEMKGNISDILQSNYRLDEESYQTVIQITQPATEEFKGNILGRIISKYFQDRASISKVKSILRSHQIAGNDIRQIAKIVKNELSLNNRIERLRVMHQLFRYWHVAHLPFAIIMLVVVVFHVVITLLFGYKWIF
jgi:hypothetical protein